VQTAAHHVHQVNWILEKLGRTGVSRSRAPFRCEEERRTTLRKKRVLITGAGSGFGRDAALRLAEHGHQVIAAVQLEKQVAEMKQLATSRGVEMRTEKLDLLSPSDRDAAFEWEIDVLVNNAAIGEGGPIAEIPLDLVRSVFEVNVFSTLALTQGFVRRMARRGSGRVIFVSSRVGLVSGPFLAAYGSSKHALEAIAEALHYELAPHGIQVATLNPGPYATGFNERMIEGPRRWYDPKRNFTRPEELAKLRQRFAKQFDPEEIVEAMVALVEDDSGKYRTVLPKESEEYVRKSEKEAWTRRQTPRSTERTRKTA
jgi:NAD(P)-dependent dehydrogenase (short-subunit alcohol dehydrogenase family)